MAAGPFLSGLIWGVLFPESGWRYCYALNVVVTLLIAIGVWPLKAYCEHHDPPPLQRRNATDYSGMPDLPPKPDLITGLGQCGSRRTDGVSCADRARR